MFLKNSLLTFKDLTANVTPFMKNSDFCWSNLVVLTSHN